MYVHVKKTDTHPAFYSPVYALLNSGVYAQAVVYYPLDDAFLLTNYTDFEHGDYRRIFCETVCSDTSGFAEPPEAHGFMFRLNNLLRKRRTGISIKSLRGYPEVLAEAEFLAELLQCRRIPRDKYPVAPRALPDSDEWNYITVQADAELLIRRASHFHDAAIRKIVYNEAWEDNSLLVYFDNCGWCDNLILCFEGVRAMNLRASSEYSREIFGACLLCGDDGVFFADEELEVPDLNYTGTYITALSVKWRNVQEHEK